MAKHDEPAAPAPADKQGRSLTEVVAAVVVAAVIVAFILDNRQPVAVRYVVATGHPKLIWVMATCFVVGVGLGALVRRPALRRSVRRKSKP